MVIRTRGGGRREVRMPSDLNPQMSWSVYSGLAAGGVSSTGEYVHPDRSASIPAVLNAIRLVAGAVAMTPLRVYSGRDAEKRAADGSWQWRLLHDRPNDEQSRFDFWWDVAASVETRGNAFIQKIKVGGAVALLYVIDPDIVTVKRRRRDGRKVFVVRGMSGEQELTSADVLHVRGPTLRGGDRGLTPLQVAADTLAASRSRYSHEAYTFKNGASVPYALKLPEPVNRQQFIDAKASWIAQNGQAMRSGQPLVLNGTDVVKLGLTMEDAQFVEGHRFSVEDVARMFNLPPSMLAAVEQGDIEQETTRFLSFGAKERLDRIRDAFAADDDFFDRNTGLYPEHFTDEFVRVDAQTKDTIYHQQVQDGRLLVDEARAEMGREPLPDGLGQIPQITPVGGKPNPVADAANTTPTP